MRFPIPQSVSSAALLLGAGLLNSCSPGERDESAEGVTQIRWATSATGSAGHRAKVALAGMLNREMPEYRITVMPTAGAVASMRGYATGSFEGYYGADIAFRELDEDSGRFRGFRDRVEHPSIQSFWAYSMEVGLAIRADDRQSITAWGDLRGRPVFTGPAPWDVRAQLERALDHLEVAHRYREVDTGLAGSLLADGSLDAFVVYTAGESRLAPWVAEAEMAVDLAVLNPSPEERERLAGAGFELTTLSPDVFRGDPGVDEVVLVPFFYGFHLGLAVPEEDVYRMLNLIEAKASDLARADHVFAQLARDMVALQRRGIIATGDHAAIHPGLARFLRAREAWDPGWDDRVASE